MQHPEIYTGVIQPFNGYSFSGINKKQMSGSIMLTPLGFEGDEQAEKSVHGGVDRAVCHYPREHYEIWQRLYPEQADAFNAPAFGENVSTLGLTEHDVYIGDIYRWDETLIQVTQPRSPCYKLNAQFNIEDFSLKVQESGRCGWLYRVIAQGQIREGHRLNLLSRNSDISIAEAMSIAFHMPFDEEQYHRLLSASGLSASWSRTIQRRLERKVIESFNLRLFGHHDK